MTLRRRQECRNSTIVRAEAVRDAFQHPGSVALINRRAASVRRVRIAVSPDTPAQSHINPNENAVWSCSPIRMG
jgi:hypothetical protein